MRIVTPMEVALNAAPMKSATINQSIPKRDQRPHAEGQR